MAIVVLGKVIEMRGIQVTTAESAVLHHARTLSLNQFCQDFQLAKESGKSMASSENVNRGTR